MGFFCGALRGGGDKELKIRNVIVLAPSFFLVCDTDMWCFSCIVPTFCCFTALSPLFHYTERCFSCQQTVVRWVVVKTCAMESHKGGTLILLRLCCFVLRRFSSPPHFRSVCKEQQSAGAVQVLAEGMA